MVTSCSAPQVYDYGVQQCQNTMRSPTGNETRRSSMLSVVARGKRYRSVHCPALVIAFVGIFMFCPTRLLTQLLATQPAVRQARGKGLPCVSLACSFLGPPFYPVARFQSQAVARKSNAHANEIDVERQACQLTVCLRSAASAKEVLQLVDSELHGPVFNMIHASTAFTMLARLDQDFTTVPAASAIFDGLVIRTSDLFDNYDAVTEQSVANILWSLGVLRRKSMLRLVPQLVKIADKRATEMTPQGLSNIFWATATLQPHVPELLKLMPKYGDLAESNLGFMVPQALANTCWSMGLLRNYTAELQRLAPPLAKVIQEQIIQTNNSFTLRDVADVSKGVALSGHKDLQLMTTLAQTIVNKSSMASRHDSQFHLPEVVWAFDRLGIVHKAMMKAVAQRLGPMVFDLTPWSVSILIWAYEHARLDQKHDGFMQLLRGAAQKKKLTRQQIERSRLGARDWVTDHNKEEGRRRV